MLHILSFTAPPPQITVVVLLNAKNTTNQMTNPPPTQILSMYDLNTGAHWKTLCVRVPGEGCPLKSCFVEFPCSSMEPLWSF